MDILNWILVVMAVGLTVWLDYLVTKVVKLERERNELRNELKALTFTVTQYQNKLHQFCLLVGVEEAELFNAIYQLVRKRES